MDNTCVCCGAVIPEGRMVCWVCENRQGESPERTNDMKETMNPLYAVVAAALGVLSSYLVQRVIPLAVLVAAMLAAACCVALVLYWPGAFDSLGIYLFLLVAAPVLLQADSYTAVDNMREFWGRTLRFLRDFCIIILVSGALRELLRHNTLLGLPVAMSIRTEAAEQPFFGLILSGFLLAVLRAMEATLRRAIHRRRQAETVGKEAEA